MNKNGFQVEWVSVTKLKPAKYNPRKDLKQRDLEYKKIQKSINEFGLVDPLIVNKDYTVIGGHQRLKVLSKSGFDKVPCSIVDLDKQKEKALNIALNKITGEWDLPKLSDLLIELDVGDFDMESIGFSPAELKNLLVDNDKGIEEDMDEQWGIYIECATESEQQGLLEKLIDEGVKCKALIS